MAVVGPRVMCALLLCVYATELSLRLRCTLLDCRVDPRRDRQRSCLPDGEDKGKRPQTAIQVHGIIIYGCTAKVAVSRLGLSPTASIFAIVKDAHCSVTRTHGMKPSRQSALLAAPRLSAAISVFAVTILTACFGGATEPQNQPPELVALPRAMTQTEVRIRDASNRFSFALWNEVNRAPRDSNVFISPLSASFSLGMTMNGAASTSYIEMRDALQFSSLSPGEINAGYRSLLELLLSLDPQVEMKVANSIWYREDFPFRQTFLDSTRKYFGATVSGVNFNNQQATLSTINGWAGNATNGRIPKVLNEITADQVMFLINAIYFKGSWRSRFDPEQTVDTRFNGAREHSTVLMMKRSDMLQYMEGSNFQAVEMPYGNGAFVMDVLLPSSGVDVSSFALALPQSAFVSDNFARRKVDFWLPRFTVDYERNFNQDLKTLGMHEPFIEGSADFSGMAPSPYGEKLFIDFVKQNTFVAVDEEGTEAAAVTTTGISTTSVEIAPVIHVDRPFVFVLRERLSGTVLFMGKIVQL